jgi:Putative zinc-finger
MADSCWNEEVWLLLPWLANGRLSQSDRARVEAHVCECALCAREVALQRLMCDVLTEPERVTYAPGPSFRKLLERIDGRSAAPREDPRATRVRAFPGPGRAAWRAPGLAWAASFLLVVGLAGVAATTYRWSQPLYATHTAAARPMTDVLHIAFVPSLSVGEAGALLRSAGARVVEGPDASGIFGVSPVSSAPGTPQAEASVQLRTLAARLRSDARVRWVQPLTVDASAGTSPER